MDIGMMREFIVLADTLNFTAAAERLYITQPTLSRHVDKLEDEVGAQLLKRSTHGVELTEPGRIALAGFRKIVSNYDSTLRRIDASLADMVGSITVGMLTYAIDECFTPAFDLLRSRYPNVDLVLVSCQLPQMLDNLFDETVDVGLALSNRFVGSEQFCFEPIGRMGLAIAVSDDHPLAGRAKATPSELADLPLVFMPYTNSYFDTLKERLEECGFDPARFTYAPHNEQVDALPFLLRGTSGGMVVARHLHNMQRKGISIVDIDDERCWVEVYYAYKKTNENPVIPLLVKCARQAFSPTGRLDRRQG